MSRDDYPHDGPLRSRKATEHHEQPPQVYESDTAYRSRPGRLRKRTHLFLANGQPTITPTQRALLRQAQKHLRNIDIAHTLLTEAIRDDNPDKAATAIRSLTANAVYLTGYVNDAENDAA